MNDQPTVAPTPALASPDYEVVALVLQGGGALGSYQAGVYQALAEAGLHPDWVAGISIGAINSALIAGNPPERRVERLRAFWETVTEPPLGFHPLRGYKITDERDIYELVANMAQRRVRACILATIPGDVVESAQAQCEETLNAKADTSPEGLKKLVAAFASFSVTQGQIEKRCQCRLEGIRAAQVVQLKKIYVSIRDGMSRAEDWFPVDTTAQDDLAAKVAKASAPKQEAQE